MHTDDPKGLRFLRDRLPVSFESRTERVTFVALAGSVSLALISIAASQILLAVAIGGTIWLRKRRGKELQFRFPFFWPLLLFFLWTIVSALASSDIRLGLGIVKKFYIFLLLFLVPALVRGRLRTSWIYRAVFAAAAVSSVWGIVQFIMDPGRGLLHRISGSMSHWMTYSALLMLALVALSAYALCIGWGKHGLVIILSPLIVLPIYFSQTRNAWLGAVAGLILVLLLRRPWAITALIAGILAIYVLSPNSFRQRLHTGWNLQDPNTRNRIELFETSMRLIGDNPWFGVGPKNVSREALHYRGSYEFPDWLYQHMHNNFLQIAAERGIPGLLLWLWLMARFTWDAARVFRAARARRAGPALDDSSQEALMSSTAALGATAALLAAGFFEYNFGDSEVLALFLFMVSAPYAFLRSHDRGQNAAVEPAP